MTELLLLLLVLIVIPLMRAGWGARRRRTTSIRVDSSSWPFPFPEASPDADFTPGKKRRRRRAATDDTADGREEATATGDASVAAAGVAPRERRDASGFSRPARVDLRRAIVWSEILGPPRGLQPGPDMERTSH